MYPSQIPTRYALCTHIKYAQFTGVSCFNLSRTGASSDTFFFSTWYLKLARASIMKNCLSSWMCISRCPDSRHALARAEECLRGCGQLLRGVKTLDKSSIYPWWAPHGSLTAGNKDTVCERISKEMPSRPVVPGQERTAVSHTAPGSTRCSVLPRGFQHWIISRSLKYRFV